MGLVLIGCKGEAVVAGTACSEVPFAVGWEGRGLCATAADEGVEA